MEKKIKISLNPKREEKETFKAYKIRRLCSNLVLKKYLKGKLIWNSASLEPGKKLGTYNKVVKQGQRIGSFKNA